MMDSIGQEIIVGIILAVGSKLASNFWNAFKLQVQNEKDKKVIKSKSYIKTQFYAYLPLGILCLIAAPHIEDRWYQYFAWVFAFIGFLGVWNAFDSSLSNWEEKVYDEPVDEDSNNKTD